MKVAIINDTHFGARSDSREFNDYFLRFYREIFFPELDKRKINTLFHLGDIVDRRKYINFTTLNSLRINFIEEAEKRNIDMHFVIGNHDIFYRNTNNINAMQETFSRHKNVHLYSEPTEIEVDGCKILFMPWINNTTLSSSIDAMNNTKAQILFGHLEIKGFEMYRGVSIQDGLDASVFGKFDIVASGHFHKKSHKGNIHYLGAPYQITWSDYDDHRGFHIFDTDTREFEYIINPFHMFHKVLYNDKDTTIENLLAKDFSHLKNTYVKVIIQNKENPYWFDLWLNKIYFVQPIEVTIVEDHQNMDTLSDEDILSHAEDTMTVLLKYVKNLETRVDNVELEKLMRALYTEAINLELNDAA